MPDNNDRPSPFGRGAGGEGGRRQRTRPNPYAQVALTYVRRPFSSCLVLFLALRLHVILDRSCIDRAS